MLFKFCILKGKWPRSVGYLSTVSLLYAANRTLAVTGSGLKIIFTHVAYMRHDVLNYFLRPADKIKSIPSIR